MRKDWRCKKNMNKIMNNNELIKLERLAKKYKETNIPLYLSYPTESWWRNSATDNEFVENFKNLEEPFLYFHFPYCKKACYYCCCYKEVTLEDERKETYIQYLEKEFNNKLFLLGLDGYKNVKHMHWGGGTPTYMSCNQLERVYNNIFSKIDIAQGDDTSISIEAYPDEKVLTADKLKLLRSMGFNEISFGIQDFDERVQKVINRDCKKDVVQRIIETAKDLGFRVHIDLCYGLPFQGLNELERTVNDILEMKPDRIATFAYAHYPMAFPMQKLIPMASIPNSFIKVLLSKYAGEAFTDSGYFGVGTDHFVKQDNPLYKASLDKMIIRDFMGYSVEQRRCFIGFGNSAISFSGKAFYHNIKSIDDYVKSIDNNEIPLERNISHVLTTDDIMRNKIIQKCILCDFLIEKSQIEKEYGICFDDYFKAEMDKLVILEQDGLLDLSDSKVIKVTDTGKLFARHIAYAFDRYYNNKI